MATFRKADNRMVTCPFDSSHRMLASRIQMHIAKCKSAVIEQQFDVCPFNATHQIPKGQMMSHITKCPDREKLDALRASAIDKNNVYKGNTNVPSYIQNVPERDEIWNDEDAEPGFQYEERWDLNNGPGGYVPPTLPPSGGLIGDLGMMKPADRKNFYKTAHSAADDSPSTSETHSPWQELRQPRKTHEDLFNHSYNLGAAVGLGRGQPKSNDTRIAANIFGKEEKTPFRQPESYRSILNQGNIGLGRGRNSLQAEEYDSSFPALGIGRGVGASNS